jgi:hypothetical protein
MVDIASIDFLEITQIWGKRALSDRLLAELNRNRHCKQLFKGHLAILEA